MFRADAFDRHPNACDQGDDAGDNEELTKKLCEKSLAAVGHLCHEPSLIRRAAFRPLQFAAIFGARRIYASPSNPVRKNSIERFQFREQIVKLADASEGVPSVATKADEPGRHQPDEK